MYEPEQLLEILAHARALPAESETVEFKTNFVGAESFGEYISALANAAALAGISHAFMIFGVEDGSHEVVGTTFEPSREKAKGNQDLIPWVSALLDPSTFFEFHTIEVEGKRVVITIIEAASGHPTSFKRVEWIRIGAHKKRLIDHHDRARRLWAAFDSTPWELRPVSSAVNDERLFELLNTSIYFELAGMAVPASAEEILEVFDAAKFIAPDGPRWRVTAMGALLLAKNLGDFPGVQRKAARVIQYEGGSQAEAAWEQLGGRGYAAGFVGLLQFVERLVPGEETFADGIRRIRRRVPQKVLRELIANALIHQDLSERGTGPLIEVFGDRLQVTNPGESLVEVARIIDGHPKSRNEQLARAMRSMGICDERGSGWDQIAEFIEGSGLPAPILESADGHMRVVVFWERGLSAISKDDAIRAMAFHASYLHSRHERVTNATVRARFGLDDSQKSRTSKLIKEAVDAGVIKIYDPAVGAKARSYVPWFAPSL